MASLSEVDNQLLVMGWIVIAVPFVTGALLAFIRAYELRKTHKQYGTFTPAEGKEPYSIGENAAGFIGVLGLLVPFIVSVIMTIQYFSNYVDISDGKYDITAVRPENGGWDFLPMAGGSLKWGILLNPLSVIFMLLLALIALLIHLYATEYMHNDGSYTRFFSFLNLFTGSMFGFVLAGNLFMGFIFWELLGFTSYLLIGYFWRKDSANDAGKKAFLYNKVGDVSFMVGIALVWARTSYLTPNLTATLDYFELQELITSGAVPFKEFVLPALLIFGGAVGKSAQVPLFGWLPEAMEGPTPVSALLHSSTMVKAGLYLTARIFFMFYGFDGIHVEWAPEAALTASTIAWVGTLTALVGGLIALSATDIKKVLAFSTISQLGYIGLALGAGGLAAGYLHIISHATFKSLLFLGAGSVIHAVHSQEMDDMGGLRKHMPITYITMAAGVIGLMGFPLSSGFWSKDAVLLSIHENHNIFGNQILWILGLATASVTAFYSVKLLFKTFHGEPRYDTEHVHPHEPSWNMKLPLIVLGALVVIESLWWLIGIGFGVDALNLEHQLAVLFLAEPEHAFAWNTIDPWLSMIFVAAGAVPAYLFYGRGVTLPKFLSREGQLHKIVDKRFGFDILITNFVKYPVFYVATFFRNVDRDIIDTAIIDTGVVEGTKSFALGFDEWDQGVVDGFVNYLGDITRSFGKQLRALQTGQTGWYARMMAFSVGMLLTVYLVGPTIVALIP